MMRKQVSKGHETVGTSARACPIQRASNGATNLDKGGKILSLIKRFSLYIIILMGSIHLS